MFKDFEGQEVSVIVSTKGANVYRYDGKLKSGDNKIQLENASISISTNQISQSIFGQGSAFTTIAENLPTVTINRDYVISVNAK
jgi:hypothetical protein